MHFFLKQIGSKLNDAIDINSLVFTVFFSVFCFVSEFIVLIISSILKKKMCNVNVDLLFSKCF